MSATFLKLSGSLVYGSVVVGFFQTLEFRFKKSSQGISKATLTNNLVELLSHRFKFNSSFIQNESTIFAPNFRMF
jgi:hypothetical protein